MAPLTVSLIYAGQNALTIYASLRELRKLLHSGTQLMSLRDSNSLVSLEDKCKVPTSIASLSMKRAGSILEEKMDRSKFGPIHAKL